VQGSNTFHRVVSGSPVFFAAKRFTLSNLYNYREEHLSQVFTAA